MKAASGARDLGLEAVSAPTLDEVGALFVSPGNGLGGNRQPPGAGLLFLFLLFLEPFAGFPFPGAQSGIRIDGIGGAIR